MNNLDKILKGINLYPSVGDKYINIVLKVDMKKYYREIFEIDCTFEELIKDLKEDKETRNIMLDIVYEYFGFKKMPIITNSSYETWYFVEYKDKLTNPYTIGYVDKIARMNVHSMLEDYIDLFNNNIIYKMCLSE